MLALEVIKEEAKGNVHMTNILDSHRSFSHFNVRKFIMIYIYI